VSVYGSTAYRVRMLCSHAALTVVLQNTNPDSMRVVAAFWPESRTGIA
jgi:hypothetical protein